jgi:acid phosphatase type 7
MHDAEWMAQTNRQAMKYDPDFIAWGGDLAYANARPERVERWYDFFEVIRETLIHEDGRVVPVIVSIGNHEVEQRYVYRYFGRTDERRFQDTDEWRAAEAPYFYALFAFPGPRGYNVLDFGDYLSMVALDSYHTNLIAGDQINWLHETLSDRRHVPHVFPFYHVPVWASVKGLEYSNEQREVRMHFPSVFEKYGIRVAFENHDHAYKRTPPMRGGEAVGPDEVQVAATCSGESWSNRCTRTLSTCTGRPSSAARTQPYLGSAGGVCLLAGCGSRQKPVHASVTHRPDGRRSRWPIAG